MEQELKLAKRLVKGKTYQSKSNPKKYIKYRYIGRYMSYYEFEQINTAQGMTSYLALTREHKKDLMLCPCEE